VRGPHKPIIHRSSEAAFRRLFNPDYTSRLLINFPQKAEEPVCRGGYLTIRSERFESIGLRQV
jgi:hypothetical protein